MPHPTLYSQDGNVILLGSRTPVDAEDVDDKADRKVIARNVVLALGASAVLVVAAYVAAGGALIS